MTSMMNIEFEVYANSPLKYPLSLTSWIDGTENKTCTTEFQDQDLKSHVHTFDLPDESNFVLSIELSGIRTDGNVFFDDGTHNSQHIILKNFRVNDINILPLFIEQVWYYPDNDWYNEQRQKDPDSFPVPCRIGEMIGWNGKFELEMKAPIYTWLLEHI